MSRRRGRRVRFGQLNAPETGKAGLIRDRMLRALAVLAWLTRHRIGIAGMQESGTYAQRAARRRRWWRATYAHPQYRHAGRARGVGILHRWRYRLLDEQDLRVAHMDDRAPDRIETGAVYAAVRLFRLRGTRLVFAVIVVHAPWRRGDVDGDARRELRRLVLERVRELEAAGIDVVVQGDTNGVNFDDASDLLTEVARHGVDRVYVTRGIRAGSQHVTRLRRLSDHPWLWLDLFFRINRNRTTPRRLP